jgi:hypothetical protein
MKNRFVPVFALVLLSTLALYLPAEGAVSYDRINITASPYNAIPNDGISDTAAINSAIAAGRSIYFPPGTYNYTGLMTLPANTSYRLYGDGPGVSTIIFTGNPTAGIYAPNVGVNTLNVEGLLLQGNTFNCGTAIYASFSEAGAATKFRTVSIHNVQINGANRSGGSGGYWTRGIHLYRAQNTVIDKVEINGNTVSTETGGPPTQFGIVWESSNTYATTGLEASNLQIKYVNTALQTNGWVEGVFVQNFEFTFSGKLNMPVVDLNSFDTVNPKPAFHLVNGHVHTFQHGIRLTNLRGVKLTKLLILHHSDPAFGSPGNDIAFNNCSDGVVSQCSFIGAESIQQTGILLNNAHLMRLEGNYFIRMINGSSNCIAIQSNSNLVRIVNNLFETQPPPGWSGISNRYSDAAPDTYYWGNN